MKTTFLFVAPFLLGVPLSSPVLALPAGAKASVKAPAKTLTNRQLLQSPDAPRVGGQLQLVSKAGESAGFSSLKHTDVRAQISGSVVRVEVEQQFENTSKTPVEAIYTFPLPEKSAVDGMEFRIGERRIIGQIKEKQQAQKIYDQAKAQGKRAALLDQQKPNIFTQRVANILPGDSISVRISFVQTLDYRGGAYEWSFPTVVGPRYQGGSSVSASDSDVSDEVRRNLADTARAAKSAGEGSNWDMIVKQDAERFLRSQGVKGPVHVVIDPPVEPPSSEESTSSGTPSLNPPYAVPGTRSGHDLSLHVSLDAGVPLQNIRSVLHPISVSRSGTSRAQIELKDQATLPNRDFILRYSVAGQKFQTGLLTQSDGHGGGYFALVMQPPSAPKTEDISPRELVFVVDQTGSQSGFPIAKSKEAMRDALTHLRPNDTFQVLAFNTEVFPCFQKPVAPTKENLSRARTFVQALDADGGTDILKALAVALQTPADPKRLRLVVYLTDGYVSNDEAILEFERRNRGTTRVFPFGMGDSVNRSLLEGMAREGRGSVEYVTMGLSRDEFETQLDTPVASGADLNQLKQSLKEQKAAVEAVQRFNRRIETPVLISPQVSWGGLPVADVLPDPINDVFETAPIIVLGRFSGAAKGFVTLSGFSGERAWKQQIPVDFGAAGQNNPGLESLWARGMVDQIGRSDASAEDKKAKITQLALAHRLLSQYTSFVAVEEKIVNPGGKQNQNDVPSEVPQGVNAAKAGASPAPRYGVSNSSAGTFAAQPGDPLIEIKAAPDTLSVLAILPDGTPLPLRKNARTGKWEARFDIPTYAPDGPYAVQILINRKGGKRTKFSLRYLVDTQAPQGIAGLKAHGDHALLSLQAGDDVERVMALLPWGERLNLTRDGQGFSSPIAVPAAFASRRAVVTLVLTDHAHNRTTISLDWN